MSILKVHIVIKVKNKSKSLLRSSSLLSGRESKINNVPTELPEEMWVHSLGLVSKFHFLLILNNMYLEHSFKLL